MASFSSSVYPGMRITSMRSSKRARNVQGVGRRHEHHFGQVQVHFQVVVVEGASSAPGPALPATPKTWITPEVHRSSCRFHPARTADSWLPDLGEVLHQPARHRADVGPAMAADFGLVAHAAQATCARTCDWSPWRWLWPSDVLPTPGGPTRAQDWRHACCFTRCLHSEIFEDALFDLLQTP
jgi:hypothetical protein